MGFGKLIKMVGIMKNLVYKYTLCTFILLVSTNFIFGQADAKKHFENGKKMVQDRINSFNSKYTSVDLSAEFTKCIDKAKDKTLKGECLAYRGYFVEESKTAFADFEQAYKLAPNNPTVLALRGRFYIYQNDEAKALKDFDKAAELGSRDENVYFHRGQIFAEMGEYRKAINDFTKVLKIEPNFSTAYIHRADAYTNLRAFDKAIADYDELVKLFPKGNLTGDLYQVSRGRIYQQMGDKKQAEAEYKAALKINENDESATEALNDLYFTKEQVIEKGNLLLETEIPVTVIDYLSGYPEFSNEPEIKYLEANAYLEISETEKADSAFNGQAVYYLEKGLKELEPIIEEAKNVSTNSDEIKEILKKFDAAKKHFDEMLNVEKLRIEKYEDLLLTIDKSKPFITNAAARYNLGKIAFEKGKLFVKMGDNKQAFILFDEAIKNDVAFTQQVKYQKMQIEKNVNSK